MAHLVQILVGVSLVIGLILMTASSLLVHEFRLQTSSQHCKDIKATTNNLCATVLATRAAGSLGIVGAIIQICVGGFLLFKFTFSTTKASSPPSILKTVTLAHYMAIFLFSNIGFAIGVHYYNKMPWNFLRNWGPIYGGYSDDVSGMKSLYLFFNTMAAIDWIFCVAAVVPTIIVRNG